MVIIYWIIHHSHLQYGLNWKRNLYMIALIKKLGKLLFCIYEILQLKYFQHSE